MISHIILDLDITQENNDLTDKNSGVTIAINKIRRKWQTIIKDFNYESDSSVHSSKEILSKLKKKICSCNGHISEEGWYVLQGDHRGVITTYLQSLGINDIIESGTK